MTGSISESSVLSSKQDVEKETDEVVSQEMSFRNRAIPDSLVKTFTTVWTGSRRRGLFDES